MIVSRADFRTVKLSHESVEVALIQMEALAIARGEAAGAHPFSVPRVMAFHSHSKICTECFKSRCTTICTVATGDGD